MPLCRTFNCSHISDKSWQIRSQKLGSGEFSFHTFVRRAMRRANGKLDLQALAPQPLSEQDESAAL